MTDTIEGEAVEIEPQEVVTKALDVVRPAHVALADELTVDELVARTEKVKDAAKRAMIPGHHFGVIPGTGTKPSLLKPGAEKLCLLFRLAPTYDVERDYDGDHLTATAKCVLVHGPTGMLVAEGVGLCTTKERKYAIRRSDRVCPNCGEEAIKRSKFERDGDKGWYCFKKIGGCGMEFPSDDPSITGQEVGDKPNPDLPDSWNTVVKMAEKRALVAAVLNGTAASDVFTQDVEDEATEERTTDETEWRVQEQAGRPRTAPRSFTEASKRLNEVLPADEAAEWMGELAQRVYSEPTFGDAIKAMDTATKNVEGQRFAGFVLAIEEDDVPRDPIFNRPLRRSIQELVAKHYDGVALMGPQWRIVGIEADPDEEKYPEQPGPDEPDDLGTLTKAELADVAIEAEIEFAESWTRAQLIEAIRAEDGE